MLTETMLPSAHQLVGLDFVFQHDNAPCHTARSIREWIEDPTPEALRQDGIDWSFELMTWPAQSPDLNPIEHLWDAIERELSRQQAPRGGLNGLTARVLEIWDQMALETVQKLVDSMPECCQEVINSRGSFTSF